MRTSYGSNYWYGDHCLSAKPASCRHIKTGARRRIFAKRLQTQETMTSQIAQTIQNVLEPKGVALLVDAAHQCMTTRGVQKQGVTMVTTRFTGAFEQDKDMRDRFLLQAGQHNSA